MDLRAQRTAAGMSQSQLAAAARVSQPNLSAYENGRRSPSPEVLDRLTRALAGRPSARIEQHRDRIRAIVAEHRAAEPRVFGSVARGEDRDSSDLDLLVLFDDVAAGDRRALMGQIRGAIGAPIPIDVLVASISEYEARKDLNGSPYYWPAREGRVVYERAVA